MGVSLARIIPPRGLWRIVGRWYRRGGYFVDDFEMFILSMWCRRRGAWEVEFGRGTGKLRPIGTGREMERDGDGMKLQGIMQSREITVDYEELLLLDG